MLLGKSRGSVVGIGTGYGLDDHGSELKSRGGGGGGGGEF
jgi:hypothetical protein